MSDVCAMAREHTADDLLSLITTRRSIAPKRLQPPAPTPADIMTLIEAALSAPDHGGLRPWRLIQVTDSGRERLAEVFVAAKRRQDGDASLQQLARERDKALNAPLLLVVVARPQAGHTDIPLHEQWVAVGAAVQNMLLAAHALGHGASLLSVAKARDPLVRASLGLAPDETLVGFLSIGTIATPPQPRRGRDAVAFLSFWSEPMAPGENAGGATAPRAATALPPASR